MRNILVVAIIAAVALFEQVSAKGYCKEEGAGLICVDIKTNQLYGDGLPCRHADQKCHD
jgi:hypothetical protein